MGERGKEIGRNRVREGRREIESDGVGERGKEIGRNRVREGRREEGRPEVCIT